MGSRIDRQCGDLDHWLRDDMVDPATGSQEPHAEAGLKKASRQKVSKPPWILAINPF
jgi:hypothetical protein